MYHVNVNVNLMVENMIQIKSGITINVDVSVGSIIDDSGITCDQIIDTTKSNLTKTVPTKKKFKNFLYFTFLFISYHSVFDSC